MSRVEERGGAFLLLIGTWRGSGRMKSRAVRNYEICGMLMKPSRNLNLGKNPKPKLRIAMLSVLYFIDSKSINALSSCNLNEHEVVWYQYKNVLS